MSDAIRAAFDRERRAQEEHYAAALALSEAVAAYRAELEGHLEAIEGLAARHGWTYALAPSDTSLRALFTGKLALVGGAA